MSYKSLTERAREALEESDTYSSKTGVKYGVLPDGRPVRLLPSRWRSPKGIGTGEHRLQVQCSSCGEWIPAGRMHQHRGTKACYEARGTKIKTRRDPEKKHIKLEHRYDEARKAVAEAIARFPKEFGLRAFPGDRFRISPRASYVSGDTVMLYTERFIPRLGDWYDFAKDTEDRLRREIIPVGRDFSRRR